MSLPEFDRFREWLQDNDISTQTVFDVGAAKGHWAERLSKAFPSAEFHLFDPRINFDEDLNQILLKTSKTFKSKISNKAVAAEPGTVEFCHHLVGGAGSSTLFRSRNKETQEIVEVEAITLDNYAAENGIDSVDILKMDIQGGELNALRGAQDLLKNTKFIILETWLAAGYGEETPHMLEVFDFLRKFGIYPFDFFGPRYNPMGTLSHIDVIYHNVHKSTLPSYMYKVLD